MKAVVMTKPGGPEVLKYQDVPDPKLETDTQILVRLRAAGVNPIDTKLRQRGTLLPNQKPNILGCDGAGVVEAVGSGVSRFQVGDEVYFCQGGLGGPRGNYAEYIVLEEQLVVKKPASLSFAEAAAAPLVLLTAWEALYDRARLEAGQRVLIHGGAGGVGHVAIQLAKLKGAEVCTTVSSEEKASFVRNLGADFAILYKEKNFVEEVLDWTHGEGVDIAFDTLGGKLFEETFPAVRIYGDIVTILEPGADTSWKVARNRNLRISLELMLTPMLSDNMDLKLDQVTVLRGCDRLIEKGQLKIHLGKTFPLKEAAAAHTLLEGGSMTGKIALLI
ncbi:MAG TPA: zinc-dependent alcohol dehydrogenase family protein [Oscillatoriaceae cyanobacterium M33_DOE_052]|uniref:Alcohol dehydrogenase n=1 Tax=Planktothricoides sp. SpSt-374 TaxID=2282167 RepID=A0A7C3VQI6_9CYAN|nr:zinc-dependent alcohol dehydrogenase family protein [Oscillatoriaceae cyanobacterium M33_DOE_052]